MPERGTGPLPREERLGSALAYLAAIAGTGGWQPRTTARGRIERLRDELGDLLAWAQGHDCVLSRSILDPLTPFHHGSEHRVFVSPAEGRVFKFTHPDTAGYDAVVTPTAWEYLDRTRLCNEVFRDDVWLEGVLPSSEGTINVVSQPFILAQNLASPHPTHEAMMAWLRGHGFEYEDGAWVREADRLVLEDAHIGNFVVAQDSRIVPVDVKLRILPAP